MNTGIFLVTFRESLEAAMVIGIVFTLLSQRQEKKAMGYVIYGTIAGLIWSIIFAGVSEQVYDMFDGMGQEVFNACILFFAASLITTFIFWVNSNAKKISSNIKYKIDKSLSSGQLASIFFLVFFSVLREGIELVFFLGGLLVQNKSAFSTTTAFSSGLAGMICAGLLVLVLFKKFAQINIKVFFQATTGLLLFVAAGMFASASAILISIDMLPAITYEAWNSEWLLSEQSTLGSLFSVFFGYNSNPTLMEIMIYFSYLLFIGLYIAISGKKSANSTNKQGPVLALTLALLLFSSPSAEAKKVYSPLVEEGEIAIEYYNDYIVSGDATKMQQQFEVEYSFAEMHQIGLYLGLFETSEDKSFEYQKSKLRLVSQFFEKGELFIDIGTYIEYQTYNKDFNKDDVLEFKILLEKSFDQLDLTWNPVFVQKIASDDTETEVESAMRLLYRMDKTFSPAIEFYSFLGNLGDFNSYQDQEHIIGPVIFQQFGTVKWEVGVLFGMTDASEDYRAKLVFEKEFY
ncbi:MAG: FTR1 family protein [SAR324 cluster bacterium]|nr:FTR1 family protein [SAR324 cluster bacterium]